MAQCVVANFRGPYKTKGSIMSVIIWGWGNYNRRGQSTHRGTCESCGYVGPLRCYDASRFFSLYFVPLIPLGGRHVIDECPACKAGRMTSRRQWKKLQANELPAALEAFDRDPRDAEKAERALVTAMQLADVDTFRGIAERVAETHASDAAMLARVGAACGYHRLDNEAIEAFEGSLLIEDNPDVREALTLELIHQGRPDEAAIHLQQLIDTRGEKAAPLVFLLAEGYQANGQHAEALAALDEYANRYPELAERYEKQLDSHRRTSQRHLQRGRPVAVKHLAVGKPEPRSHGLLRRFAPAMVLPGIIAFIAIAVLIAGFSSKPEHVYLVNGLDEPYDVSIDGKTYSLAPHQRIKLNADYGPIALKPVGGEPPIEPADLVIEASFFDRVFGDPTFVINPDRDALLVWENAQYAPKPQVAAEGTYRIHLGEPLYSFEDLDYRFRELPEEITLNGDRRVWRETVEHITGYGFYDKLVLIESEQGQEAATRYVRRHLRSSGDDMIVLGAAAAFLPNDELIAAMEKHLDDRPIPIEMHRYYQQLVERTDPDRDLAGEYRARYEADPGNSVLAYLAIRLVPDPDRAEGLLQAAIDTAAEPCAYLHHGLAFSEMNKCDFDAALAQSQQALAIEPDNALFLNMEEQMLLATRAYPELLRRASEATQRDDADPLDPFPAHDRVKLFALVGDTDAAEAAMESYLVKLGKSPDTGPETVRLWRGLMESTIAQAAGNPDSYRAAMIRGDLAENYAFSLAINTGDWSAADAATDEYADAIDHLIVYAGANHAGMTALAEPHLTAAIDLLREGDASDRLLADWLAGDAPLPDDASRRISFMPVDSRVVLTALAQRFPDRADEFNTLANQMNFEPMGYHLAVERLTGS